MEIRNIGHPIFLREERNVGLIAGMKIPTIITSNLLDHRHKSILDNRSTNLIKARQKALWPQFLVREIGIFHYETIKRKRWMHLLFGLLLKFIFFQSVALRFYSRSEVYRNGLLCIAVYQQI